MLGFEIVEVTLHQPLHKGLKGCFLDLPKAGRKEEGHILEIAGWALSHEGPAEGVEILSNGHVLRRIGMDQARPDLAAAFPNIPRAAEGGFFARASVLGINNLDLVVQAVLGDQTRAPMGKIRVRRRWRDTRAGAQGTALVSVIITCSGQECALEETIESVRAQTFPHLEVVVIHDSSPQTPLCEKYPWATWVQQDTPSLAGARNTGIRLSTGGYLVFLDAGERLLPDALETGLDSLKDHAECAVVFGNCHPSGDDRPGPDDERVGPEQDYYLALLTGRLVPLSGSAMYPREVFEHVPEFSERAGPLLDYHMFLDIARNFPIHCHEKTVAEHRLQDSEADSGRGLKAALTLLREQRRHLKGNAQRQQAYRDGVRHWRECYGPPLVRQLQAFLQGGDWKKAQRAMKMLVRFHPEALASWWEGKRT